MPQKPTPDARMRTLDLAYAALFAALTAVCAWISIPMTVPFTLQIFGIFAALTILGGRRGTLAIIAYLLLGAVGLPVFAGFSGGLGALLGASGGYLWGFLASALIYWLVTALLGDKLLVKTAACLLGLAACYLLGTAWFVLVYSRTAGPVGFYGGLVMCVFPFVIPDLVKIALALLISLRAARFVK